MQIYMLLFVAALFYVLTPGILLTLPPKGSKMVVAVTHAIVFAVVYGLVHKAVLLTLYPEGFAEGSAEPSDPAFQACISAGGLWVPEDTSVIPAIPSKCKQMEGFAGKVDISKLQESVKLSQDTAFNEDRMKLNEERSKYASSNFGSFYSETPFSQLADVCIKTPGARYNYPIPSRPVMTDKIPAYCELSAASCKSMGGNWDPKTSTCPGARIGNRGSSVNRY